MTTGPLKSLSIKSFRGSSATFTLPFEKGRKLTLVYGENGTGKTTICDAFEFLAHGKVSSLEGNGLGKGLEKYWPTAGKPANDLSVTLESGTGTCSGKITDKKASVTPHASRPRIELLRRQQIVDLIKAQPKDRYDAIKRFIDIAEYEASEETLRQQAKSLATEKTQAQQAEGQSLQELQGFYEAAGEPAGFNAVTWAKDKLSQPAEDLNKDITAISALRTAFENLKGMPEKVQARQLAITKTSDDLKTADAELDAAIAKVTDGAADLVQVLEEGSRFLHDHSDATACPLCLSKENAQGLADQVDARLGQLTALRLARGERQKFSKSFENAQSALDNLISDYTNAVASFSATKAGHNWKTDVQLHKEAPPTDIASLGDWLLAYDVAAQTWAPLEATWRDEKKFVATLKGASERYETNLAARTNLDVLVPRLELALKHSVEQRQAFTTKIIGEIAGDVGKLYEKIHPGEGLEKIALPLDPDKRASIEIEAHFSGHDVPPQAYFSQSHLDTLGLCVFLALAIRDKADDTILILDDVLGSIDEPHVERVVGLIYEISAQFRHTIVTTHYRPWRERFRWGSLKPGQACQFVELSGWTMEGGMKSVGSLPEIERLKGLMADASPDVQSICGKAGVILEYALDYLTQRYECSVPRRYAGAYTLGDLLPAINGKLRDALRVEIRDGIADPTAAASGTISLKPILDELAKIAQVRNAMGAHFKEISFDLLDQDAMAFATQVVLLVDALSHPEDGWPNNDKSGSYWRNSGDSRRLHPLKKPS